MPCPSGVFSFRFYKSLEETLGDNVFNSYSAWSSPFESGGGFILVNGPGQGADGGQSLKKRVEL